MVWAASTFYSNMIYIYIYMYIYTHTYIHTDIQTYIHAHMYKVLGPSRAGILVPGRSVGSGHLGPELHVSLQPFHAPGLLESGVALETPAKCIESFCGGIVVRKAACSFMLYR